MKTQISRGAFVYALTGPGDNEAALTALEQAYKERANTRLAYNSMFATMPLIPTTDRSGHPPSTLTAATVGRCCRGRSPVGRWVHDRCHR
jgi:hypothetical protein